MHMGEATNFCHSDNLHCQRIYDYQHNASTTLAQLKVLLIAVLYVPHHYITPQPKAAGQG